MKRSPRSALDDLLQDLFQGDLDASLPQVRQLARRRRWTRRGRQAAAAGSILTLLALLFPHKLLVTPQKAEGPPWVSGEIVTSRPLNPGQLLTTAGNAYTAVQTDHETVLVVKTNPASPQLEWLDDDHLLQFIPGALLVHHTQSPDLIFPREE